MAGITAADYVNFDVMYEANAALRHYKVVSEDFRSKENITASDVEMLQALQRRVNDVISQAIEALEAHPIRDAALRLKRELQEKAHEVQLSAQQSLVSISALVRSKDHFALQYLQLAERLSSTAPFASTPLKSIQDKALKTQNEMETFEGPFSRASAAFLEKQRALVQRIEKQMEPASKGATFSSPTNPELRVPRNVSVLIGALIPEKWQFPCLNTLSYDARHVMAKEHLISTIRKYNSTNLEAIGQYLEKLGLAPDNWAGVLQHCINLQVLTLYPDDIVTGRLQSAAQAIANCLPPNAKIRFVAGSGCTDEMFQALGECCPQLNNVHLSNCNTQKISDEGIQALTKRCRRLSHVLIFGQDETITHRSVRAIASACPHLRRLEIQVDDLGLKALSDGCHELESVFFWCSNITITCLKNLLLSCPNLTSLKLSRCPLITTEGLDALKSEFPKLSIVST